jgi:hypothetical protein
MRRRHGRKVCTLTRGEPVDTPYSCGKPIREDRLNDRRQQKP